MNMPINADSSSSVCRDSVFISVTCKDLGFLRVQLAVFSGFACRLRVGG